MKQDAGFAIAETLGVIALLAVLVGYPCAMGSYWITGVGFFLMPITVVAYLLFTRLSQNKSSKKRYWTMYAVKIAFVIGLFLLSPIISKALPF